MTRSERSDSARRRRENWRWNCHMWRKSMTVEEFWTCDLTVGAAMFCACELRPRVMLTRCTKRTQLESTRDSCRAQGAQGLGFVCVGNIANDPMTKNIQNSTDPSISVISNVDNIRRRLQRVRRAEIHRKDESVCGGRSKRGKWKQSDQDQMGGHEQGNARESNRSGSMGCTGVQMD